MLRDDLLVAKPELRPNERELATYPASRSRGLRKLAGLLLLTDQRVVFYRQVLDRSAGDGGWQCELPSIADVRMSARGFNPFNGSLLPRLQIDSGGSTESFVVTNGFAIVDAIKQAAGR